ncbi:MAG: hypothetical protein ABI878_14415 [Acidobacteriota bacterium]
MTDPTPEPGKDERPIDDDISKEPPVKERSFAQMAIDYAGDVLGIALVGLVFHWVIELFSKDSLDYLGKANASFAKNLEGVDPWNLAGVYFGYVSGYAMARSTTTFGYIFNGEFITAHGTAFFLWRLIPGVFYTAGVIWAQSWFNIFVALVALGIGYAFVKDSEGPFFHKLAGAPLFGCTFLWVLLKIMMLASFLFGGMIVGINIIVFGSFFGSSILSAVAQEREHHVTGLFLKWFKPGERLLGK